MKKYTADGYALGFIRIIMLIICVGGGVAAYIFLLRFNILMWAIIITLAALYFICGIIMLPIYFAQMKYTVSPDRIASHSGLLYSITQNMKISAIQYTTLISVPLLSRCGFNFVIANALGGRIVMSFLTRNDASDIQARISRYMSRKGL